MGTKWLILETLISAYCETNIEKIWQNVYDAEMYPQRWTQPVFILTNIAIREKGCNLFWTQKQLIIVIF